MKIVLFHPVRLPPRDYGGVERVVLWLAEGLRDHGHDVSVAALEGSELPPGVQLLPISPEDPSDQSFLSRIPAGTDVVHFQAPPAAETWEKLPCAGLLTVHGNGKPGERFPKNTVFLTADHARRHGRRSFVWNGINPDEYRFGGARGGEARPLFLSKTSWRVKNLRGAMQLTEKAGERLTVAGGHRPLGLRLRALWKHHDWRGPVAGERKAELLARASCLVFPVQWPEPFGLVMIEALVSGTPVIASAMGSVPEVLTPECGRAIALDAEAEWIEAIRSARTRFDPEACRQRVLQNFTHRHMAENYLRMYQLAAQGEIHD